MIDGSRASRTTPAPDVLARLGGLVRLARAVVDGLPSEHVEARATVALMEAWIERGGGVDDPPWNPRAFYAEPTRPGTMVIAHVFGAIHQYHLVSHCRGRSFAALRGALRALAPDHPALRDAVALADADLKALRPRSVGRRLRRLTLERANGACEACGIRSGERQVRRGVVGPARLTVDHITPRARGGVDALGNTMACCSKCNKWKGDLTLAEWWARVLAHHGKAGRAMVERMRALLGADGRLPAECA